MCRELAPTDKTLASLNSAIPGLPLEAVVSLSASLLSVISVFAPPALGVMLAAQVTHDRDKGVKNTNSVEN